MSPGKRSVYIVDDHAIVRQGLVRLLAGEPDIQVLGSADSAAQAIRAFEAQAADVCIVDLGLGEVNGLTLVGTLRARWPATRVLVLSMFSETLYAERALRAGAHGYLMKSAASDVLLQAIRKVIAGGLYFSDRVEQLFYSRLSGQTDADKHELHGLTDRQLEVLRLLADGLEGGDIAAAMNVSIKTVESHRAALKAKLGARSNTELLRLAIVWQQKNTG